MDKDRVFKSLEILKDQIDSKLILISKGECTLEQMDVLLSDIRELQERIIIIRYKAMERMSAVDEPDNEHQTIQVREPELPLDIEEIEIQEESESNQISLIDSIEEISREVSVNENHVDKSGPSLAEKLESEPIDSIMNSLSVNMKMGLVNQVFKGDDELFKDTIANMDSAANLDKAMLLMKEVVPSSMDEENPLLVELIELTERRFQ